MERRIRQTERWQTTAERGTKRSKARCNKTFYVLLPLLQLSMLAPPPRLSLTRLQDARKRGRRNMSHLQTLKEHVAIKTYVQDCQKASHCILIPKSNFSKVISEKNHGVDECFSTVFRSVGYPCLKSGRIWPSPWKLRMLKGHVEVETSHALGVFATLPHFNVLRVESVRTDFAVETVLLEIPEH